MPQDTAHSPRCFIVADDLTGSCDAAVHFAARGVPSKAAIDWRQSPFEPAPVVAVNTDSRSVSEEEARFRVSDVLRAARGQYQFTFKKIDSALRGHVAAEVRAAAEAMASEFIFVAPALPVLNRRVQQGAVALPSGEQIQLARALAPLPVVTVATHDLADTESLLARMQQAAARGVRCVCFDAETDDDLDAVVALGPAFEQRVLWVGSAGLAAAIARASAGASVVQVDELPAAEGPVLFGVGSDHDATLDQVRKLKENGSLYECSLDALSAADLSEAVRKRRNALLHIPRSGIGRTQMAALAAAAPLRAFRGLVLTGGDTATAFLRAAGAHTLEVRSEVLPGIPISVARGGMVEGMRVITKSGAFGEADAFTHCVEYLQGPVSVAGERSCR